MGPQLNIFEALLHQEKVGSSRQRFPIKQRDFNKQRHQSSRNQRQKEEKTNILI